MTNGAPPNGSTGTRNRLKCSNGEMKSIRHRMVLECWLLSCCYWEEKRSLSATPPETTEAGPPATHELLTLC